MSKTEDALKEAFAGESQANRKYLAFAAKADQEGFAQVAKLFRAAAEAETVHAHAHLRALKGIRSTRENLQEAIAGETHEFKSMYPAMIEEAKAEGFDQISELFSRVAKIEKTHEDRYRKLLSNIQDGLVFSRDGDTVWMCFNCGHVVIGKKAPELCPVCKHPKAFFEIKADNY